MSADELKSLKSMPFEKALEKLEDIVDKMEEGELPLDEMIKNFENGNKLSRHCAQKLKSFEKKIEILTREDSSGGQWDEFDPDSGKRNTTYAEPETENQSEEDSDDYEEDSLF